LITDKQVPKTEEKLKKIRKAKRKVMQPGSAATQEKVGKKSKTKGKMI